MIKKILIIIWASFGPFFYARLEAKSGLEISWYGTTCINISDGKTALFFDPFINRPSIWQILSFQNYEGRESYIKKWLKGIETNHIKAIFVSHTHYDHVLDLVKLAKMTPSKIYGSPSAGNILKGGRVNINRFEAIDNFKTIEVGKFKVTVLPGYHPPHLFGLTIGSGSLKKPLPHPAAIYEYKMGKLFNFFIEHPNGNILFHPSGQVNLTKEQASKLKASLVIQGIANRKSSSELISKIFEPTGAKFILPVHHDDLTLPLEDGFKPMLFSNYDEFKETIRKDPRLTFHSLKYGEKLEFRAGE